jgi:hypothetical protein
MVWREQKLVRARESCEGLIWRLRLHGADKGAARAFIALYRRRGGMCKHLAKLRISSNARSFTLCTFASLCYSHLQQFQHAPMFDHQQTRRVLFQLGTKLFSTRLFKLNLKMQLSFKLQEPLVAGDGEGKLIA